MTFYEIIMSILGWLRFAFVFAFPFAALALLVDVFILKKHTGWRRRILSVLLVAVLAFSNYAPTICVHSRINKESVIENSAVLAKLSDGSYSFEIEKISGVIVVSENYSEVVWDEYDFRGKEKELTDNLYYYATPVYCYRDMRFYQGLLINDIEGDIYLRIVEAKGSDKYIRVSYYYEYEPNILSEIIAVIFDPSPLFYRPKIDFNEILPVCTPLELPEQNSGVLGENIETVD